MQRVCKSAEASGVLVIAALALILGFSLMSSAQAQPTGFDPAAETSTFTLWPKWGPFLDVEGKLGSQRNLGEVDLFVPLWQDERSMLFGDARFKADDQNSHEGNFGLGYRHMLGDGWNGGIYGYFDRRRSPNANLFNQLTFGAELLGTNFDFRVNSYWPVGDTVQAVGSPSTGTVTATVTSGSTLQVSIPAVTQAYEYALRGFDAEAGVRIPITPAESPYKLRFYAGGFRFDDAGGAAQVVAGPRLRLEFTDYDVPGLWGGTRFTVSGEWQTDQVRGSQFFAGLRLRVPLQAEPRRSRFTLQERRMTDPVVRDVDIVASTQSVVVTPASTETAVATSAGQTIVALNSSTTSGTALPTAITNAGVNSTVVLQGSFNTGGAVTTLRTGQTVMGNGSLGVRTNTGRSVTVTLTGGASLTANVGGTTNYSVVMAGGSTLQGLTINNTIAGGNNALGVSVSGVNNVRVLDNTINTTIISGAGTSNGIQVRSNANNVTVSGNTVTAIGGTSPVQGIQASTGARNLTVSGNRVTVAGQGSTVSGIYFQQSATSGTISNNVITASNTATGSNNPTVNGIEIASNATATVSGNTATVTADVTKTSGATATTVAANGLLVNSGATATVDGNVFSVVANITNTSTSSGALTVIANGLRVGGTSAATLTARDNSFSRIVATGSTSAASAITITANGFNLTNGSTGTLRDNSLAASSSGGGTGGGAVTVGSNGVLVNTASITASGNSETLSSGGTVGAANLTGATIASGSTGNYSNATGCISGGGNTGSIGFTGGTTCP